MKFSKIISLCMSILLITAATSCNNTVDDNAPHEDHKEIEEEKPEELTVWIQETFNKEFNEQFAGLFDEFGKIKWVVFLQFFPATLLDYLRNTIIVFRCFG